MTSMCYVHIKMTSIDFQFSSFGLNNLSFGLHIFVGLNA